MVLAQKGCSAPVCSLAEMVDSEVVQEVVAGMIDRCRSIADCWEAVHMSWR